MLFAFEHAAVYPGQPESLASAFAEHHHEVFVDLSGKDHLHDLGGLAVGIAQSADELRLFADAFEHLRDLGPAAVDEHDLDADQRQHDYVAHHRVFKLVAEHRVAAVLDDNDLAVVFPDVGQRVAEHARLACDIHVYVL